MCFIAQNLWSLKNADARFFPARVTVADSSLTIPILGNPGDGIVCCLQSSNTPLLFPALYIIKLGGLLVKRGNFNRHQGRGGGEDSVVPE